MGDKKVEGEEGGDDGGGGSEGKKKVKNLRMGSH